MNLLASRGLFFGVMGSAAVLSLLRGFALAAILPITEFGIYAIVVAIGAFSSNFLGLGRIEDTRKRFPRMFVDGQGGQVPATADRIVQILAVRAFAAAVLFVGISWTLGRGDLAINAAAASLIAFSTGWASVAISAHRATGEYSSLASSTLWRAILALSLGLTGAWYGGWVFAIAGEFLGGILGALISRSYVQRIAADVAATKTTWPDGEARDNSGLLMFISFSLCAAPFYLDRLFVGHVFGAEAAGTYGFLMLFVTGATVFLGIAEQQLGPALMKRRKEGAQLAAQMVLLVRWIVPFQLLMIAGMAIVGAFVFYGPGQFLAIKFSFGPPAIIAVAALCCLQITTTFDWLLQSLDREKGALRASIVYVFAVGIVAVLVADFSLSLETLIFGLAAAKACHIAAQFGVLWMNRRVAT